MAQRPPLLTRTDALFPYMSFFRSGVVADRLVGEQRDDGGVHGDAGARPVLRNGARGHMDVDVALLERVFADAEIPGPVLQQAEGGLRALLHHVAELSGKDQLAAAGGAARFDEEDVAAGRRPGKAGRDARQAGPHGDPVPEAPCPPDAVPVLQTTSP